VEGAPHSKKGRQVTGMVSVIAPTYNEAENIRQFISDVSEVLKINRIDGELIIIDDNSPDGTALLARGLQSQYNNLEVMTRDGSPCLSRAVQEGFGRAKGEIVVVMDADLSHPAEAIPRLVEPLRLGRCQMAICSRYVAGGGVTEWPLSRRAISRAGAILANAIAPNVKDAASGFFAVKRSVFEDIKFSSNGQKIGLEIIAKGNYTDILEVPYIFKDRQKGKSKFTLKVALANLASSFFLFSSRDSCSQ